MTDPTTNFGWDIPNDGADDDVWGDLMITIYNDLDAKVLSRTGFKSDGTTILPMTGPLVGVTPAAGSGGWASIRLPHGVAPTTNLANGDLYSTTAGLFFRRNGGTKTLAELEGATFTGLLTVFASTTSGAGFKIPPGAAPTSPSDGMVWSDGTNLFARIGSTTYNLTAPSTGGVTSFNTRGGAITLTAADVTGVGGVLTTRQVIAGTGMSGGGTLAADRTLSLAAGGVGTTQLADDGVTNAKLANMATNRIKGRVTASTGDPEDLTGAQVLTILGLDARLPTAWAECTIGAGIVLSESGYNAAISTGYLDGTTGTGKLKCTFDSALASAAYAVVCSGTRTAAGGDIAIVEYHTRQTDGFNIYVENNGGSGQSPTSISVAVFGPL